jgi:quinol-cytochrome oxidoreductase complex cytochrome b subunit
MNEQEKQEYLEKYHEEKEKGVPFYPNIIFKDVVVSFIIFLILVGLAYFVGAPLKRAVLPIPLIHNPEWCFYFSFSC